MASPQGLRAQMQTLAVVRPQQMSDPRPVLGGATPHQPPDFVPLGQEQFGQVGTILTGDPVIRALRPLDGGAAWASDSIRVAVGECIVNL